MQVKDRQLEILETAGAILTKQGISGVRAKNLVRCVGLAESALAHVRFRIRLRTSRAITRRLSPFYFKNNMLYEKAPSYNSCLPANGVCFAYPIPE
ncbi:MAG: hypothetical protein IPM81_04170 [Saprospirales bacterium]|nr:hypothetical protein [Saprospirales bacterium]